MQYTHVGANFKYFIIILIVSTNYIFVQLLDNKVFYLTESYKLNQQIHGVYTTSPNWLKFTSSYMFWPCTD